MSEFDRRRFLKGSLATLGAGGAGAAIAAGATGSGASAATQTPSQIARDVNARQLSSSFAFDGVHQSGILTQRQNEATVLALDSLAPDRGTLGETLQALTTRARQLAAGTFVAPAEIDDPPPDSGVLGPVVSPDLLTVTVGFGASLFDHRYGLRGRRPRHLIPMPSFANDELVPARTGGDIVVQVCAGQRDTVVHTVRELMRTVAGTFTPRWTIDGFQTAQRDRNPRSNTRNLFAFRDGTGNPEVTNAALMDRLVWAGADEPAWARDGTYMIVRDIRMHVEFWDRVGMFEQQNMIGRDRTIGAPLGGTGEFEDPDYPSDPHGKRIPLDAHIRLANPRTARTEDQRMLRRTYNYHRGVDSAGNLDQGLVFVAFNQDPERQFATVQRRLEDEPMVDYITPTGGGYFFVPPGTRGGGDWIGSGLLA